MADRAARIWYAGKAKRRDETCAPVFANKMEGTVMLTFHECCARVVKCCPDPYAKSYAQAGLSRCPEWVYGVTAYSSDVYAVRTQALYILNNMTRWRGELAKECRETLRAFSRI